ncbi:MAG: FMN-binding protein [Saprospiraceae bacterium]
MQGAATGYVVYAGYGEEGTLQGIAIPASGQGYADVIRVLYGYDMSQQAVVGMYVLESKETPGLGDKVEKDDAYKANFKALDVSLDEGGNRLKNIVEPVKNGTKTSLWQVDCITGATISSRAIGNMISQSTAEWYPSYTNTKQILNRNNMSSKTTEPSFGNSWRAALPPILSCGDYGGRILSSCKYWGCAPPWR